MDYYELDLFFFFFFPEKVSMPNIDWNCINKTLVCKISNGTDAELKLYVNGTSIKPVSSKFSTYRFINKQKILVNCTAENKVSKESDVKMITCSGAWQALVRHPKLIWQTQPVRSGAETRSGARGTGLGGSPLKTLLFLLETFKGSLEGERGVVFLGVRPWSTI